MGLMIRECKVISDGALEAGPLIWRMSRVLPSVSVALCAEGQLDERERLLGLGGRRAVTVRLEGEADDVEDALVYLRGEGMRLTATEPAGRPCFSRRRELV